jgi:hypothetical protein
MDAHFVKLKQNFSNIVSAKGEVVLLLETLEKKIMKLKEVYDEFIKKNKNNLFVFGLDSFHFQSKLIYMEHEDMKRIFYSINNRIYCEYFKLHGIIVDYLKTIFGEKKTTVIINSNKSFPVYKDLEPFKQYSTEHLENIHDNLIVFLNEINNYVMTKRYELDLNREKKNTGLNIDNFVYTFEYEMVVVNEKLKMFVSYIEFFHALHFKYINTFSKKIELVLNQLNHDIKFDKNQETSTNVKEVVEEPVVKKEKKGFFNKLKTGIKKVSSLLDMNSKMNTGEESSHDSSENDSSTVSDLLSFDEPVVRIENNNFPDEAEKNDEINGVINDIISGVIETNNENQ